MQSYIRFVCGLLISILMMAAVSCAADSAAPISDNTDNPQNNKITSLQAVIDNAQPKSTIDLSLYKDIPNFDYKADVNQTVTIKNGELNNAMLTVVSDNVELTNIQNVSVTASPSLSNGTLKISGSSLNSLNILGGGSNSIYLENGSVVTGQTILNKAVVSENDEYVRLFVDSTVTVQDLVVKQSAILDAKTSVGVSNLKNVTFNIDNSDDKAALAIDPNITFNRDSSLACVTFINSDESVDIMKIFVHKSDRSSIITADFLVAAFERLVQPLDDDTKMAMVMQFDDIIDKPIDSDICMWVEGLEPDHGDDSSESDSSSSSENGDDSSSSAGDSSSESESNSSSEAGDSSSESSSSSSSEAGDSSSESDSNSSNEAGDSSSSSSDSSSASSSSAGDNSSSSSSGGSDPTDPITYTVRFHIGAGSSTDNSVDQTMTYGEDATLTPNTFSVANWVFMGWSKQCQSELGDSVTIDYTDGQSVSNLTDVENGIVDLYAVWDRAYIVYANMTYSKQNNATTLNPAIGVAVECDEQNRPTKILFMTTTLPCSWTSLNVTISTIVLGNVSWYAPDKDDLILLKDKVGFMDAALSAIDGATTITSSSTYWSSTANDLTTAWRVDVLSGEAEAILKTNTNPVRPMATITY